MIPFMLALMCITGLHQKNQCPTKTPISNHQLRNIWSPTNPYLSANYLSGYWLKTSNVADITTLKGKKLRIAAIEDPPYVTKIYPNGTLDGVAKHVITILRGVIGFDYEIVVPPDGTVGIFNKTGDGTWSGIIGMLKRGDADFSIQYISMLPIRTLSLNFSAPFGEINYAVMMQRPQESTNGDGLVAPFQTDVWYYLLLTLLTMCPLTYTIDRLKSHARRKYPHLTGYYTFGACVWFVYGALMKQGSVLKPFADSIRILMATWWIFVTILTAFYTANLTAYLTLSKIPIPYDSLDKIGYRDSWVTSEGDTLEQIMSIGVDANVNTDKTGFLYSRKVQYPEFAKLKWRYGKSNAYSKYMKNITEMTEEVRRNKFLLLEEKSRIERIIYRDFRKMSEKQTKLQFRCNFIMSRNSILRVPYGFGFTNETMRNYFHPVLSRLAIGGLFHYWRVKDLPVKDPCSADSDFRERQLRNGDLLTTYILCGIGYSLGLSSFIAEFIFKVLANRKIQTQLVPTGKLGPSYMKGNVTLPGAPTYFDTDKFLKTINGRNYIVVKTSDGRTKLVPKLPEGMQALQPIYQSTPAPAASKFIS